MEAIQHFVVYNLVYIRAVHIIAATIWAWHFISAMFFLIPEGKYLLSMDKFEDSERTRRAYWAYERYDVAVIVEHLALLVLFCAGGLMYLGGVVSLDDTWFVIKLVLICLFAIPGMIIGIWVQLVITPKIKRAQEQDPEAYFVFRRSVAKGLFYALPYTVVMILSTVAVAAIKPF